MRSSPPAEIPVFILCGGRGTRLGEVAQSLPKPMVDIGGRPLLLHVMQCYDRCGFRRFVLCTGWRGDVISSYFLNFPALHQDFTLDLRDRQVSYHQVDRAPDWEVTVAHTGRDAMTGARIARAVGRYLGESEHFAVTYGDGLTDVDLAAELAFHRSHGGLGTMLGVHPPSQYGCIDLDESRALRFDEKPRRADDWINAGFFFFRRGFLDYLSADEGCVLEQQPLRRLAADGELRVFRHEGFWSSVDTIRDRDQMVGLWEGGAAPWLGPGAA
jgi:glucose-1-phosphate cytidylyltransferase